MLEKRSYERMTLDGFVNVKTGGQNPFDLRVFLNDFSFGGFSVYSKEKLNVGRLIEFDLTTDILGQGLVGRGKIRHVSLPPQYSTPLYTIGVEFRQVNKDQVAYIINRIQAKISQQMQTRKDAAGAIDFMAF